MIKITQINLNRANGAHDLLEDRIRREGIDICIINEANHRISDRKRNKDEGWICDEESDAAIWIVNKEIIVKKSETRQGTALVETQEGLTVVS